MANHKDEISKERKNNSQFIKRIKNSTKRFYYFFQRRIFNWYFKKKFKNLRSDLFKKVDCFLYNEGGMFKKTIYNKSKRYFPIKNSKILVPGVGWGKHLITLATFRPKKIVAFDIFEFSSDWNYLKKLLRDKYNVEIEFYKGEFEDLPNQYKNSFDWVVSEAVLEHVKDMPKFLKNMNLYLKKNGIFYGSFGPIWYGPNGDHINWQEKGMYYHLLAPEEDYEKSLEKMSEQEYNAIDGVSIAKNKFFSYLKAKEYFDLFLKFGYEKIFISAKISSKALKQISEDRELEDKLNKKGVPEFDRYCPGLYFWMKKLI